MTGPQTDVMHSRMFFREAVRPAISTWDPCEKRDVEASWPEAVMAIRVWMGWRSLQACLLFFVPSLECPAVTTHVQRRRGPPPSKIGDVCLTTAPHDLKPIALFHNHASGHHPR